MVLTQEAWQCLFETYLAALPWTFSVALNSFSVYGSQSVAAYARICQTRALCAVSRALCAVSSSCQS